MQVDTLRLLTVDEVARRFRQSRLTIRRKIATGQLEAVRLGEHGPLRVPEAALAAYLQPVSSSERAVGSLAEGGSP
jgi:excisionase family DNA binding protein